MNKYVFLFCFFVCSVITGCIFDSDDDKKTVTYTLSIMVNQTDWGTTNPSAGSYSFNAGKKVTITATPARGYRFVSWTGSVADSTSSTTTVTMSGDRTVTANFEIEKNRFYSSYYGFSIVFPEEWETTEDSTDVTVTSFSPVEDYADYFRENVNVVVVYLSSNISIDDYYQQGINGLKLYFTDFKVISSGQVTIDNTKAKWHISTYRYNTYTMKVMQYMLIKNQVSYIITSTALSDTFDNYKSTFETITLSFQFETVVAKNTLTIEKSIDEGALAGKVITPCITGAQCLIR